MSSRRRCIPREDDGKGTRLMTSGIGIKGGTAARREGDGMGVDIGSASEKLDAFRGQRLGRSNGDGGGRR